MTTWVELAGWTLVHFLWQGTLIALALAAALRLLSSAHPQARYAAACLAMAAMLAAPTMTAVAISGTPRMAPFADSVHLLRSGEGAVIGVAVTPPWTPPAPTGAGPSATEFALPRALDTQALFPALVALWLSGVIILLTRLGAGCWRVRQLHVAACLEPPSRWQPLAEQIAARLRLPRRFLIVDSTRVVTPTVIGWLRPIVMLPAAALSGLTTQQVEAILAHELAHIRRHDFAINLLQTVAETVLFYHPAVWWVSRRIRVEREHCCDDVAVVVCGDATAYAAALTELASWSIAQPALAMAATRGPLISRVRRLLRMPEPADRTPRRTAVAVSIVLSAAIGVGVLGAMLRAQPLNGDSRADFGPPRMNEMLGFDLFPGPVELPGADPIGTRAWGITVGDGVRQFSFIGFTARSVIREAYDLGTMPIVGAPRWMDRETFDVHAPADLTVVNGLADPEQVRTALQQMLEGRLGLTTHRETRHFPAYAMVLANEDGRLGPSIAPSTKECSAGLPRRPQNPDAATVGPALRTRQVIGRLCGIDNNFFGLSGARVTMAELASEFHRTQYPISPDREIVDRTGLTGAYDFELRFGILPLAAIGYANPTLGKVLQPFGIRSVFTALPEQLGLKLVDATVSHEVLVIDQINRP